jgi:hypothetical protein
MTMANENDSACSTSARRDRLKPYAGRVVALAILVLATGLFVGWQIGKRAQPDERALSAKLERIEARRENAEAEARELVGEFAQICANFDFFFKHDMANGAFRPVRCSLGGRDETVLFAFGFDSPHTQQAWVSEWGNLAAQSGATLVEEETWAVVVLDPSIVEEVRSIVLGAP